MGLDKSAAQVLAFPAPEAPEAVVDHHLRKELAAGLLLLPVHEHIPVDGDDLEHQVIVQLEGLTKGSLAHLPDLDAAVRGLQARGYLHQKVVQGSDRAARSRRGLPTLPEEPVQVRDVLVRYRCGLLRLPVQREAAHDIVQGLHEPTVVVTAVGGLLCDRSQVLLVLGHRLELGAEPHAWAARKPSPAVATNADAALPPDHDRRPPAGLGLPSMAVRAVAPNIGVQDGLLCALRGLRGLLHQLVGIHIREVRLHVLQVLLVRPLLLLGRGGRHGSPGVAPPLALALLLGDPLGLGLVVRERPRRVAQHPTQPARPPVASRVVGRILRPRRHFLTDGRRRSVLLVLLFRREGAIPGLADQGPPGAAPHVRQELRHARLEVASPRSRSRVPSAR
mmetsp:Transcript_6551/g.23551  ORF Transcript_6551/g.23551 Transcript_6551/m.23551 type:complete len:392 (-) Transcript_6551:75-1250(-)